jgi:hypothetical protein
MREGDESNKDHEPYAGRIGPVAVLAAYLMSSDGRRRR